MSMSLIITGQYENKSAFYLDQELSRFELNIRGYIRLDFLFKKNYRRGQRSFNFHLFYIYSINFNASLINQEI